MNNEPLIFRSEGKQVDHFSLRDNCRERVQRNKKHTPNQTWRVHCRKQTKTNFGADGTFEVACSLPGVGVEMVDSDSNRLDRKDEDCRCFIRSEMSG